MLQVRNRIQLLPDWDKFSALCLLILKEEKREQEKKKKNKTHYQLPYG